MNKKKDLTGGDHSFKNWFKIMWENNYITIASIALIAVIAELWNLREVIEFIGNTFSYTVFGGIMTLIGALIPIGMLSIVSFKGFYQKWNDLKNGRSR